MNKNPPEEQFTIDNGAGNGYSVYYQQGNAHFTYEVTYNDNGCRLYSRTKRIRKEDYEQLKQKKGGNK